MTHPVNPWEVHEPRAIPLDLGMRGAAILAVLPLVAVVAVPLASVHGAAPVLPALARLRARDLRFSCHAGGRVAFGADRLPTTPFSRNTHGILTTLFFTRAQGVLRLHRWHPPECFRRGVRRLRSPKP